MKNDFPLTMSTFTYSSQFPSTFTFGVATASAQIEGAAFTDGRQEAFDAVILATGYRPGYEKFLAPELQPERSGVNARSSELGLYLVGFYNPVTGLLREIGREAKAVAAEIARRGG